MSVSASTAWLRKTLHVSHDVAACAAALNAGVRHSRRFDRLVQLDRYVMRANVRHESGIFSIAQPIPTDTTIVIKGTARTRGHWSWQPVLGRCGLQRGQVRAISIEPRGTGDRPTARQKRVPGANYVFVPVPSRSERNSSGTPAAA